jgi:hypothetical protein
MLFTLSNGLATQLFLGHNGEKDLVWHKVLAEGKLPSSGSDLRKSIQAGLDNNVIQFVARILPNNWPDYSR